MRFALDCSDLSGGRLLLNTKQQLSTDHKCMMPMMVRDFEMSEHVLMQECTHRGIYQSCPLYLL